MMSSMASGCQRTHRADEAPHHGPFGGHGHQHLQDGPATGALHLLAVLRETLNLHHKEALQNRRVHLWHLREGSIEGRRG